MSPGGIHASPEVPRVTTEYEQGGGGKAVAHKQRSCIPDSCNIWDITNVNTIYHIKNMVKFHDSVYSLIMKLLQAELATLLDLIG